MAMIKTPNETEALKRAAKMGSEIFARVLPLVKVGVTEKYLADKMQEFAEESEGFEALSFPTIVAAGAHGAEPHAEPSDRVIKEGDLVTIDFGVIVGGYCSDMTRTFSVGSPNEKQCSIYDSVLRAQMAGVHAARAGMTCGELDKICRDIIEEDGYGEYFIHTTGHGIGTEVHEDPRVGKNVDVMLEAGMAITIEPGIYINDFGGVRIEDTVILTEDGCEVITAGISKALTILE